MAQTCCFCTKYTRWFSLTPIGAWAAPGKTIRTSFFPLTLELTIIPVTYNESPQSRWQTHICVGSGLRCREKLGKFVSCNAGRTRTIDLNRGAFPVSCVQPKETFYGKPVAPMKSAHSEGLPFGGLNSSGIKEPKWAILNPRKFLSSRNLFHPSYLT